MALISDEFSPVFNFFVMDELGGQRGIQACRRWRLRDVEQFRKRKPEEYDCRAMPLTPGSWLDHYEILAPLGAGGMGEVYRASDSKLQREVAIKILPPQFAADSGRLSRFQREAQLLASLNHPNIAAVYGLEHVRGIHFLVMELVEGQTIAERLSTKQMEVTEALRFAVQIADAMQTAHDKGVIHRDLKPANVKITPEGKIKVLDFGLAKALNDADPAPSADPANSPTITAQDTRAGIVMGTAAYMSPEQANGESVDRRADIWGFGVLLFEMLSGKRAFAGKTTTHTLLKVLEQEPDWNELPSLPAGVREVLDRCLQKIPDNRLRDIGDIRVLLQSAITKPVSTQSKPQPRAPRAWMWPAVAGVVILAALGYVYFQPTTPAQQDVYRFEVNSPNDATPSPYVRVSPDGSKIAFIAAPAGKAPQLWVRPLQSSFDARALEDTEGTDGLLGSPFWTSDSRYLVFSSGGKLRKIDPTGGPAEFLTDQGVVNGGFSTRDGQIIFGRPVNGIAKVPAAGGTASPVGDSALYQFAQFPSRFAGDDDFLFTIPELAGSDSAAMPGIYVGSLNGGEPRRILPDISRAVYAPSADPKLGYVLFVRGSNNVSFGVLMAQPIDPQRGTLAGDAVPIAENVFNQGFSASNNGVLVHGTGGAAVPVGAPGQVRGRMTWRDRSGNVVDTFGETAVYRIPAISPDDKKVAVEVFTPQDAHLEIFEVASGIPTRFTFEEAAYAPVWSPDGKRLAYIAPTGPRTGGWFVKNADRSGREELMLTLTRFASLHSWSRDGRFLLGNDLFPPADIYSVDLTSGSLKDRQLIPVSNTPQSNEVHARFSPDGNWFAYVSNESGVNGIYVRPWDVKAGRPGSGGLTLVSKGGSRGGGAMWSRDGKELFYLRPDGAMMAVEVTSGATFSIVGTRELFKIDAPNLFFFDVSTDGRFLMPTPDKPVAMMAPFKVITNWVSTIKK